MRLFSNLLKIILASLFFITASHAQPSISNIYFFGDSLTDTGNQEDAPYTNAPGIMWPLVVSDYYGLPLKTSNEGGNNWAVAGHTTADLIGEIQEFLTTNPSISDEDVAFVWIGSNDILDKVIDIWPAPVSSEQLVTEAMANINQSLALLTQAGFKHIFVINLLDIDITPGAQLAAKFYGPEILGYLREVVSNFNTNLALTASLASVPTTYIDANTQLKIVLENSAAFGITNTTLPWLQCLQTNPACNPDEFLFWDGVHPTNAAHKIFGKYILQFLEGSKPVSFIRTK